jgi:hypothetical protein
MLNLIPFNSVDGSGYERPPWDHAAEMTRRLNRGGRADAAAPVGRAGRGRRLRPAARAQQRRRAGKPVPVAVVAATTAAAAVAS